MSSTGIPIEDIMFYGIIFFRIYSRKESQNLFLGGTEPSFSPKLAPRAIKSNVFAKVLCSFGDFKSYGVKLESYVVPPLAMFS